MPVARCTEQQAREWLGKWALSGFNSSSAARSAGESPSLWTQRIRLARKVCPDSGIVPTDVPTGLRFTKTTVQYGPNGEILQEWRRLGKDQETLEAVAARLADGVLGKAPKLPKAPSAQKSDLLLEIPLFDVHFGKYCWKAETGTDYNLETAYNLVVGTTQRIVERAGEFGQALLIIGGDFFHSDTRHNQTERSGHALDVDTRHHKVWAKAVDALTAVVQILAAKAAKVKIVVIRGNHDEESAYHLQRLLAAYYRNEKQIEVDQLPRPRRYHRHGCALIGIDHGDQIKLQDLPTLMALEAPELWAKTTERVWHLGHIHKQMGLAYKHVDAKHSVQVEHIESLAGTDAWHMEQGFVGTPQRAVGFLWSAEHGLRSRIYCNAKEVIK